MRDLTKHPITQQEMLDALDEAIKDNSRGALSVGSIRLAALQEVRELVERNPR